MNKSIRWVIIVAKLIIVALACWYVYKNLTKTESIERINAVLANDFTIRTSIYLFLVLVLMVLNLVLEGLKWHYLANKIEPVSYSKAFSSLFAGLTLGIFTPARIGEYGGRVLYLSIRKRIKGIFSVGVGVLSLFITTQIFGIAGLVYFLNKYSDFSDYILWSIATLGVMAILLLLLFYYNVSIFERMLKWLTHWPIITRNVTILKNYHYKELRIVLFYSIARYIVFSTQYYLVISYFIPSLPYVDSLLMTSLIFMVQSAVPTFFLLDLGVKGSTAVYFFSFLVDADNAIWVLVATFGVWIINMAIPAIIGIYFVLKANIIGRNN